MYKYKYKILELASKTDEISVKKMLEDGDSFESIHDDLNFALEQYCKENDCANDYACVEYECFFAIMNIEIEEIQNFAINTDTDIIYSASKIKK